MRVLLFLSTTLTGFAALSGLTQAADLPVEPTVVAVEDPLIDWTGFYAGVHAGYLWGDLDSSGTSVPQSSSIDVDGGLIGAQIGGLLQRGAFVFGAEVDAALSNADGRYEFVPEPQEGLAVDLNWLVTLRAIGGVSYESLFLYATGGLAFAGLDTRDFLFGDNIHGDESLTGWAAGFGGNFRVSEHVSVNGQYLYVDLGDFNANPRCCVSYKYSATGHTARIAVNLHR